MIVAMGSRPLARRLPVGLVACAGVAVLAGCSSDIVSGAGSTTVASTVGATGATSTTTPPAPSTTTASTGATPSTVSTTSTTAAASIPDQSGVPEIQRIRPASDLPPPALPDGWEATSIGESVLGADIVAWSREVPDAGLRVVVVGGIHGNEPASPPTVRALVEVAYADDVAVWLVPAANPDGVAAGTRWNANGVDLNRNFAWGWRPDDGGPAPLSEPETRALTALIERVDPDVVVWVHQPYGYVSSIGDTPSTFEDAWSAGSGLPVRPDVTQHGGGESWTAFEAGSASMLVEIDTWDATSEIVAAQRSGFESLLPTLAGG